MISEEDKTEPGSLTEGDGESSRSARSKSIKRINAFAYKAKARAHGKTGIKLLDDPGMTLAFMGSVQGFVNACADYQIPVINKTKTKIMGEMISDTRQFVKSRATGLYTLVRMVANPERFLAIESGKQDGRRKNISERDSKIQSDS